MLSDANRFVTDGTSRSQAAPGAEDDGKDSSRSSSKPLSSYSRSLVKELNRWWVVTDWWMTPPPNDHKNLLSVLAGAEPFNAKASFLNVTRHKQDHDQAAWWSHVCVDVEKSPSHLAQSNKTRHIDVYGCDGLKRMLNLGFTLSLLVLMPFAWFGTMVMLRGHFQWSPSSQKCGCGILAFWSIECHCLQWAFNWQTMSVWLFWEGELKNFWRHNTSSRSCSLFQPGVVKGRIHGSEGRSAGEPWPAKTVRVTMETIVLESHLS